MSQPKIRAALETALATVLPAISTAYQNLDFTPPAASTPYQEVFILFAQPNNPEIGRGYQEVGYMQINLRYPSNAGSGAAEARGEMLREKFFRGASFIHDGVAVTIERTPEASAGRKEEGRWVVTVIVRFYANLF